MLITLDDHTKKFFDRQYHSGAAINTFTLPMLGLEGRVFGVRRALFPHGGGAYILQERGDEQERKNTRPCFLIEDFHVSDPSHPSVPTRSWPSSQQITALPIPARAIPSLNQGSKHSVVSAGIWRYYFDEASGFGCRLNSSGYCYLRDLTVAIDKQETFYAPGYFVREQLGAVSREDGWRALIDMDTRSFRHLLRKATGDKNDTVRRTIDFYRLDEDERCLRILHCHSGMRKHMETVLRASLAKEMKAGGALAGETGVFWYMWVGDTLKVRPTGGDWEPREVPATLVEQRRRLMEGLGSKMAVMGFNPCHDPTKRCSHDEWLGMHWALQFAVDGVEPSGHELATACSHIPEDLILL